MNFTLALSFAAQAIAKTPVACLSLQDFILAVNLALSGTVFNSLYYDLCTENHKCKIQLHNKTTSASLSLNHKHSLSLNHNSPLTMQADKVLQYGPLPSLAAE